MKGYKERSVLMKRHSRLNKEWGTMINAGKGGERNEGRKMAERWGERDGGDEGRNEEKNMRGTRIA